MNIKVMTESIIIPKMDGDYVMTLPSGATAADAVKKLEEEGRIGNLKAQDVLDSHMFICNSKHMKPEEELHDGDKLMIIKTLLGG